MEERYFGFKPEFTPNAPPPFDQTPPINPVNFFPDFPSQLSKAYRWVDTHIHGGVPSTAVQGGVDVDGHPIYVGRGFFAGDWIPAKVIPGRNEAYVCYDGGEHVIHQFQVLCETRFEWAPTQGAALPPGAVEGGRTSEGEPLYIGRAYHEGSQTIGKVHLSHGACYIPFDGKEIAYNNYEVLVLRS